MYVGLFSVMATGVALLFLAGWLIIRAGMRP